MADFAADFSANILPEVDKVGLIAYETVLGIWTIYIDGSSNVKGSGLGVLLIMPTGETVLQSIKYPSMTNNEAEYKVVIA